MSLHQDVRGALQGAIEAVPGFPPANQRAYEGVTFTSTVGTPWARMTLMSNSRRPFSVDGTSNITGGLFQIDLFYPSNLGTAAIEQMADKVLDAYPLNAPLVKGSTRVSLYYAERAPMLSEADYVHIPITVSWRVLPS